MVQLGVNSVLFAGHGLPAAFRVLSACGYDGIELSAIKGMCEHLDLDNWEAQKDEILSLSKQYGLKLLSMEVASLDEERLKKAFAAAAGLGIPVVNVGPGGKSGDAQALENLIGTLSARAKTAESFGVTLCCKAHVGCAIDSTATTQKAMDAIDSPAFGIDMDPSHIHRANEDPAPALAAVAKRVRHIHIRDCKGRQTGPGVPAMQACGTGDIDLLSYCREMVRARYDGPVCLEVIGAKDCSLEQCTIIAAVSYGYLNACLKSLGGR